MTFVPANDPRPTLTQDAHADLCTRLEILIAEYASAGDRLTATAKLHAILSRVNPASLGGVAILSSSVGSPTIVATNGPHGLTSGEKVCLTEHVGAAPALNGEHIATVIDPSHYSLPVNVTTAGAGGLSTPVIPGRQVSADGVAAAHAADVRAETDATRSVSDTSERSAFGVLRTDGPTLREFIAAGYKEENYPPAGYAVRAEPA